VHSCFENAKGGSCRFGVGDRPGLPPRADAPPLAVIDSPGMQAPRLIASLFVTVCLCFALALHVGGSAADAAPAKSTHWKAGDKVSAVWPTDGKWYDAVIVAVAPNGLFHVRYDDGVERKDITEKQIRGRSSGARGGGGGGGGASQASCPGPGLTRRCGGVCVNLQTDDNNCGACGTRCQNGKHCDGHMFCRDAAGNL